MTIYVAGLRLGSCESSKYSGLGGFGNLVFAAGDGIAPNGAQHATYDEVRIWSVARTPDEIKKDMYTQYTGSTLPQGLLTYLRGDIITDAEGQQCLYDYAGGHHATLQGNYEFVGTDELNLQATTAEPVSTHPQAPSMLVSPRPSLPPTTVPLTTSRGQLLRQVSRRCT